MTKNEIQSKIETLVDITRMLNRKSAKWIKQVTEEKSLKYRDAELMFEEVKEANRLLSTLKEGE